MPTLTRSAPRTRTTTRAAGDTAPAAVDASAGRGRLLERLRGPQGRRPRGASMPRVRLMVFGVWLLVLTWPLAAVHLFAPHASTAAAPGPVAVFPRAIDARAAQFLRAWFAAGEGTEATLAGYLPAPLPQLTGVRAGSLSAAWVTSYSVTHTGTTHDYAVLLLATLTAHPAKGPATAVGQRCYQVVLTAVGRGYNPTQPPAQTACPASGVPAAPPTSQLATTGAEGSVPDTVSRWLDAYLVGAGDITRYTSPGIRLPAITPPPATKVSLDALALATGDTPAAAAPADGTRIHVLATMSTTDIAGITGQLTYPLTLTARAGRWEVSAIDLTTHPAR